MHVPPQQIRKLGTHPLTRDGIDLVGVAQPLACWNFALTGTELSMAHVQSPDSIYSSNGVGQNPVNAILDVNVYPIQCNGLQPTATIANHPGCGAELGILNANIGNAIVGNQMAQQACADAMVGIVARKNGLIPDVEDDTYQLHMKANSWFGWDHWALSFKASQPGKPRIFIQTVTGVPLAHACSTIWDEHLPVTVSTNLRELNFQQVSLINHVATFGDLCVECGLAHGYFRSNPFNAWHRCTHCGAVYCPNHGSMLLGKREFTDRTRNCGQLGCPGRTEVVSSV
jgi:hypothetical protein